MDRDEAIRRAEIAMAWAKGAAVQWRFDGNGCRWRDHAPVERAAFPDFGNNEWRLKPKPLDLWVRFSLTDTVLQVNSEEPPPELEVIRAGNSGETWRHFREVTDE